jgi:hypothetical protein
VTVIVEVSTPFEPIDPRLATTVEAAFLIVKRTEAVAVRTTPSVVSVAVKTAFPFVEDLTVKVTTPAPLEGPEAAEIVSVAPRLELNVTVFPAIAVPIPSFSVTVIVAVVDPSD